MDFFGILFWIFVIIVLLQPVVRQKMLNAGRMRMIEQIEQKHSCRVIVLIHRQETLSLLGFPLMRFIDINDSEQVLRAIKMTGSDVPIIMILHTPGGMVLASEQIASALCRHQAKVTVMVPHYAMSGGTLVALAADEIVMDENAVLGPVDPQIGHHPAASILKVLERKPISEIDDETLILADVAEKAIRQVKNRVVDVLSDHLDTERSEHIATLLTTGTWTHDYPISVGEARDMGLPISTEMPAEVYQLMNLFPQTMQQRPSVEYIPTPYRSRKSGVKGE
jgi:ClpP class serine protease